MISIIKNKKIDKCTKDEKRQIMNFAFGEEFMNLPLHKKGKLGREL